MAAKKLDNNSYEEVGLEGPTHQDISDGKAFFAVSLIVNFFLNIGD